MPPQVWTEITAEYDGKTFNGYYRKVGETVTVKTPRGMKAAQLTGLTPEYLARMLLRELAREGKGWPPSDEG
jgi:hypothetical protein